MIELHRPSAAITQLETGQRLESGEFIALINQRAKLLQTKFQLGPGKSVLLLEHNTISFFINLLAIFQTGATAVPLDSNSTNLEQENIRKHAGINLIVRGDDFKKDKDRVIEELKEVALVLYTSGTTGNPKGVKLTYEAIRSKIEVLSRVVSAEECERTLCFLPTFFGHGLICNSLFALYCAKEFTIAGKMDLLFASNLKKHLNRLGISFFSSVPSVWELVLNFSDEQNQKVPTLKRVHCASSPLKKEKAEKIQDWLGADVTFYNIFGITEMSGWFAHKKFQANTDINSFTEFWEAQVKYSDEGELLIKAPYMFSGYLDNPEETSRVMEHGFFKTGDIFKDYHFIGRSKLVINKKGMKIYPNDIDEFLMSSGLVKDCHTFGIKGKYAGENVAVLVVFHPGKTIDELRSFCQLRLPSHKFPDKFFSVEKIDRTSRGKIALESLKKYQEEIDE